MCLAAAGEQAPSSGHSGLGADRRLVLQPFEPHSDCVLPHRALEFRIDGAEQYWHCAPKAFDHAVQGRLIRWTALARQRPPSTITRTFDEHPDGVDLT